MAYCECVLTKGAGVVYICLDCIVCGLKVLSNTCSNTNRHQNLKCDQICNTPFASSVFELCGCIPPLAMYSFSIDFRLSLFLYLTDNTVL